QAGTIWSSAPWPRATNTPSSSPRRRCAATGAAATARCCWRPPTHPPASEPGGAAGRAARPPDSPGAVEYRTPRRTGLQGSPPYLGAMMFGSFGNTDHDDSIRIIHAALDAGINFVDTADVYSFGESEEIVGKALAQTKRHRMVLATKVHGQMGRDPNAQGN